MFYGCGEFLGNGISLLYTKLKWHKARLVRLPFYARNQKNIKYDNGFTTGRYCRVTAGKNTIVQFGKNFIMGDFCQLEGLGGITIGDNVLFASKVFLGTTSHGNYKGEMQSSPEIPPNERILKSVPIIIGNNVWVGNNASILQGVKIGNGVVIGANSVVTQNIPDNTMWGGVPARLIKVWNEETHKWELKK